MRKTTISIMGMHCASCAVRIEGILRKGKGVISANVNYATGKASVEYDEKKTNEEELVNAVERAGYHAMKEQEMHAHEHAWAMAGEGSRLNQEGGRRPSSPVWARLQASTTTRSGAAQEAQGTVTGSGNSTNVTAWTTR